MHFVFDAVVGASAIKQVASSSYSPGNNPVVGRGSGAIDPSQIAIASAAPTASFQSTDVAGVLALISASAGLSVAAGTDLEIPYNKAVNGGTFDDEDALVISKVSTAAALLTLQQISASDTQDAVADILATFVSGDGLTHPIASATGETISGQTFNATHAFGGVAIDGTMDSGVVGVVVNPGITIVTEPTRSGFIYPVHASIVQRNPYMDLEFVNMEAANSYGTNFEALTSVVAYFRKRADGGTYAASGHLSASFATGLKSIEQVNASEGSPGRVTLRLWGKELTTSTSATIPSFS
ncbi:hypothetical protein GYB59_00550 [bacterium]|nr:hypothetical protein [bacterium]